MPGPPRPWWASAALFLLPKFVGVFLLAISVLIFLNVLQAMLTNRQLSSAVIGVVLILALLWFLYMKLADSFPVKAARKLLGKGKGHGRQRHGH